MFARSGQLLSAWAAVRWKDVLLSTLVSKDEHVITFLNNSATATNHAYCSTEPYLRHDTLHALIFFSMPAAAAHTGFRNTQMWAPWRPNECTSARWV